MVDLRAIIGVIHGNKSTENKPPQSIGIDPKGTYTLQTNYLKLIQCIK